MAEKARNQVWSDFYRDARKSLMNAFPDAPQNMITKVVAKLWDDIKKNHNGDPTGYDVIDNATPLLATERQGTVWERLTMSAAGRVASRWAVMDWVSQNLLIDPEQIDHASVPDQGAPAWLKWARENQKEFATKYFSKMDAPDESGSSTESSKTADGQSVEDILDDFLQILKDSEAELLVA